MSRVFTVVVLMAVVFVVACGGGSRMTVEEYAAACVKLEQSFPDSALDGPAGFGELEGIIGELKSWNPPEVLAQFHNTYVPAMDTGFRALRESGVLELMEEIAQAERDEDPERMMELFEEMGALEGAMERFDADMSGLEKELEQAAREVPPQARQVLAGAGCTLLEDF